MSAAPSATQLVVYEFSENNNDEMTCDEIWIGTMLS